MRYRLRRENVFLLPLMAIGGFVLLVVDGGFSLDLLWIVPLICTGLGLLYELAWRRSGYVIFRESSVNIRLLPWAYGKMGRAFEPNIDIPYAGILAAWITQDEYVEVQVDRDCGPYELTNGPASVKFRPEDPNAVLLEIQSRISDARGNIAR